MSKKALPLAIEIDEAALSVLGWEVANCAVRMKVDDYGDCAYSEISLSAELRFHPDSWAVRHSGTDYVPNVVWQLRSQTAGPISNYAYVTIAETLKGVRAPKLLSEKSHHWETKKRPKADDLYIWIGAFDWTDLPTGLQPGRKWKNVPVEVMDHTTLRGVRTEPTEVVARIRDKEELEVMIQSVHPLGTGDELMAAAAAHSEWQLDTDKPLERQDDFQVTRPDMLIQVFDNTGFLLDESHSSEEEVTVAKGGVVPRRSATSVFGCSFYLDDLAGKPARVVIRLTDPVG
ncbi:hypothetical protein F0U44_12260 [Nocardioides humilatus]|uniref:Uncharacterized protein n=1 Tax=Nocardioides humilatus TaxID=2607660 RepID=A0A5B1LFL3_9ACTN|nr:hypothetical protein [Nocardioides humilatus]KAA1419216.1 hypothetical protein F0U44_12260 [Nocardioides humilatus]